MNALGLRIPGSSTTGRLSAAICSTRALRSASPISAAMEVYPSRQPYTARAVCRGFRQVPTFIFSAFSTVVRSVRYTPAPSRAGRPLGKASSSTRYSVISALTKGAIRVPVLVRAMAMSATPRRPSSSCTRSEGWGVILSIMDQGKLTRPSSSSQSRKADSTSPRSAQPRAMDSTPARSFSPLRAQLSMLTMAMGAPPAWKRRYSRAAAIDMV